MKMYVYRCIGALISLSLLLLIGCSHQLGGKLITSTPTFRQFHKGDRWEYLMYVGTTENFLYEVTQESPPDANGFRNLTIHITRKYWVRDRSSHRYAQHIETKTSSLTARQKTDGTMVWGKPEEHFLPSVMEYGPPYIACPMRTGQTFDTGGETTPNGTRRKQWKVIGQEDIDTKCGRFMAWRIDMTETFHKTSGREGTTVTTTSDWYTNDKWLVKRLHRAKFDENGSYSPMANAISKGMNKLPISLTMEQL
jgi:hypothetical protein